MDTVIIIDTDGTARHLADSASESIAEAIGPKISTERSSHVETWGDLSLKARQWLLEHRELMADITDDRVYEMCDDGCDLTTCFWADCLPVGGPVLGPYEWYDEAIEAELHYLQEHNLPCRLNCDLSAIPTGTIVGTSNLSKTQSTQSSSGILASIVSVWMKLIRLVTRWF